ncbi:DUF3427 domain-containing protein [Alkalihalobacillus sp. AL-G]|uniref:DUF3427 domain-containing protein n=1 Tax=Alkalihalobacillus sp. AL-G TaxID=2926399 RepID=UPI00272C404C|nr:DEAD/DEAH box helicase [Alkalihalobacillus sp. AL-G]WLD93801.1 DUF3427 domain-containing protein [Alkalihalobacillus sp. AL-G]
MFKEGLYEEIINKKLKESLTALELGTFDIGKEPIDVEEARKKLSSYISYITRKALKLARDIETDDKEALFRQIRVCNEIIAYLGTYLDDEEFEALQIAEEGEILTSVYSKLNSIKSLKKDKPVRPVTPLSESSLFTGSNYEPNMLSELKKEILSANEIDMLVSFIKWSGLRCIIEELREFTTRKNGILRVITTSYMEATDFKAIMELSKLPNTEIKVSYDVERTRLHAKAYMFKRDTSFSTAYIGSSNLSNPALTSGLEWNVKITEKDSFDVMKKVDATFETYWNDEEFVTFNHEDEGDRTHLKNTLKKASREDTPVHFSFEIKPYHYQKEILENLQVEREVYGRNKNLLVAATGIGKTVISAFDYRRFVKQNGHPQRLLFVAHREEILKQSRDTFRAIVQDLNFGDLLVGKEKPEDLDHLFISIQSFNSTKLYEKTTTEYYDFIIVDEFHHAAASSYQKLLEYYNPKILLGMTATPERMDGKSVLSYFDDRIAAEMRLTEAINRKLLSPFQYFCVTDTADLSKLKWSRKGYDLRELENVYTHNTRRSTQILKSIYKYVTDIDDVKGVGFCVGVDHAKYMANFFNENKIPSIALHGNTDSAIRKAAKHRLLSGEIRFIFVTDLYNEGVDLPEVNTVLFLRPTESLTVFLQQLGRGLRLADDKECLTVLDFIGQAHKDYSFEEKFRALMGKTKHSVKHYVENGFSNLPKGSFIQLEKQAKDYILRNIKSTANTRANLVHKMKYFHEDTGLDLTLENFLTHHNLSLYDFYGKSGDRSFFRMKMETGLMDHREIENEEKITKRLPSLFHLDSKQLLSFYLRYLDGINPENKKEKLLVNMLYYSFYKDHPEKEGFNSIEDGLNQIFVIPEIKDELRSILNYNYKHIKALEFENDFTFENPLGVHSSYSTAQIMAAFDYYNEEKSPAFREGVKHFQEKNVDIFFITLNKSEKDFSPSTLYEDYAINERLFHWQTQSSISPSSNTGQRYIHHRENNHQIALFIREYKKENGYTSPFIFLGTADYVKHTGEKPINFTWRLRREMPPMLVPKANKNVL